MLDHIPEKESCAATCTIYTQLKNINCYLCSNYYILFTSVCPMNVDMLIYKFNEPCISLPCSWPASVHYVLPTENINHCTTDDWQAYSIPYILHGEGTHLLLVVQLCHLCLTSRYIQHRATDKMAFLQNKLWILLCECELTVYIYEHLNLGVCK
jgi:hypothetical protein